MCRTFLAIDHAASIPASSFHVPWLGQVLRGGAPAGRVDRLCPQSQAPPKKRTNVRFCPHPSALPGWGWRWKKRCADVWFAAHLKR